MLNQFVNVMEWILECGVQTERFIGTKWDTINVSCGCKSFFRLVVPVSMDAWRTDTAVQQGHPTKGDYWFPAYMLCRRQGFGISQGAGRCRDRASTNALHQEEDFANRKFAVSIDGSWVPGCSLQKNGTNLKILWVFYLCFLFQIMNLIKRLR